MTWINVQAFERTRKGAVLPVGILSIEVETGHMRLGDGETKWRNLPTIMGIGGGSGISAVEDTNTVVFTGNGTTESPLLAEVPEGLFETPDGVDTKVAAMLDAAPATLAALNALAAALRDDENLATIMGDQLAGKADQASVDALTTTVGTKADQSAVTTALATKADSAQVAVDLATKADASDLAGFADQADLDALNASLATSLAAKADVTALSTKADATTVTTLLAAKMDKSANLSDLLDKPAALSNLGFSAFIKNLVDDIDAPTARATLGLGSAAVQPATAFDAAGAAAAAQAAAQVFAAALVDDLSGVTDPAAARAILGLGDAATHPASDFIPPASMGNWIKVQEVQINSGSYNNVPAYPSHQPGDLLVAFWFGQNGTGPSGGGFNVDVDFNVNGTPGGSGQVDLAYRKAVLDHDSGLVLQAASNGIKGVFLSIRNQIAHDFARVFSDEGTDMTSTGGTATAGSLQLFFAYANDGVANPNFRAPLGVQILTQFKVPGGSGTFKTFVVAARALDGAYGAITLAADTVPSLDTHLWTYMLTPGAVGGTNVKSANYTAVNGDVIVADASISGPFTITLPPVQAGREVKIKKIDVTANAVTVAPASGTIDNAATKVLTTQFESLDLVSDGTNWFII